jgi:D-alanine-D-alanine ligase-like ATP-grasp enzyme
VFQQPGKLLCNALVQQFSGKAQKYLHVGAREFVPFDQFEELTVENIKEACEQHFTELKESDDIVCDVSAGEQGPSCRTIGQIPASIK